MAAILSDLPLPTGLTASQTQVSDAELQRYAIDLRSITQGRGLYTMTLSHYEPVPSHIADGIIAQAKRERVEAEEE